MGDIGPGRGSFFARSADRTMRPEPRTPVPRSPSPITGFVTGPPGEDIHTDKWGRVKVHFPWDRLQPKDDTCSDWIPTLQDNTGRSSAMPRIAATRSRSEAVTVLSPGACPPARQADRDVRSTLGRRRWPPSRSQTRRIAAASRSGS